MSLTVQVPRVHTAGTDQMSIVVILPVRIRTLEHSSNRYGLQGAQVDDIEHNKLLRELM